MPLEVAGMWRMIGASQIKRDVKGQGRSGGGGGGGVRERPE